MRSEINALVPAIKELRDQKKTYTEIAHVFNLRNIPVVTLTGAKPKQPAWSGPMINNIALNGGLRCKITRKVKEASEGNQELEDSLFLIEAVLEMGKSTEVKLQLIRRIVA